MKKPIKNRIFVPKHGTVERDGFTDEHYKVLVARHGGGKKGEKVLEAYIENVTTAEEKARKEETAKKAKAAAAKADPTKDQREKAEKEAIAKGTQARG